MAENLNVKVGKLEERSDNHEKRIFAIETDNKALNKLASTLEQQIRMNNKKDEYHQQQIEKQNEVLSNINTNLTNLNSRFDHMDKRVSFLEEEKKTIEKRKLDLKYKVIGGVLTSVITAAVLLYLGLK